MHPFLKGTLELPRFKDVIKPDVDAYVYIPNLAKHPNSVYPISMFVVTLKLTPTSRKEVQTLPLSTWKSWLGLPSSGGNH